MIVLAMIVLAMIFFEHAGYARRRLPARYERTKYVPHDGARRPLNGRDRLDGSIHRRPPDG
jgi:hypothetical protein